MAQLIKMYDYVSRYEWNMYRYPSQYIRLKNENWENLYENWLSGEFQLGPSPEDEKLKEEPSNFEKIKSMFIRNKAEKPEAEERPVIETELELRKYFLNHLLPFQIKWATSTVSQMSILDENIESDQNLKYFLQRFPDIYLLMYYPIFNIRNAPIDGEILMISPTNIEIIYLMELGPNERIIASDERRWTVESESEVRQVISPLISLKRTESIIKGILNKKNISFPIQRSVLSRTNPIIFHTEPFNTNIIGEEQYEDWFEIKRSLSSPLKREQLEVSDTLVQYCMSTSVRRPEWDRDEDIFPVGE